MKKIFSVMVIFVLLAGLPERAKATGDAAVILPALTMAKDYILDNASKGVDMVSGQISNMGATIAGKISDMQQSVSIAVATSINDLKNIMVDQNAKAVEAQVQMAADIQQKEAEARAEEKYLRMPPGVCESMSASAMASGGRELARTKSAQINRDIADRNALMPNRATAAMETYKLHINKYCGEADKTLKRCDGSSNMPDADVSVSSLVNGAGPPGSGGSPAFNKEQVEAARTYINNTNNSLPLPNLTQDLEKTGPGQDYVASKLADQAKMSLATKPAADALARNEPMTVGGQKYGAHIKSIWENMEKNGTVIPDSFRKELAANNDEASYDFFVKTEVDRRFSNPQWYVEMYGAPPEAVAREQAFMTALHLHMMQDMTKQMETIGLLLGGLYAEQIRNPQNVQLLHEKFRAAAGAGSNTGR